MTTSKVLSEQDPERICFVVCPLGEPDSDIRRRSDQVCQHVIRPAVEKNGLVLLRSDQISEPGMITNQIIRHILHDRLVIADLTDRNPNVFYELALRHAFNKPVVQLIESGQRIPFDVFASRTVYYELTLDGARKAQEETTSHVAAALSPNFVVDSPVTVAARLEEITRTAAPDVRFVLQSIDSQMENLSKRMSDLSELLARPDYLRDAVPPLVREKVETILQRYAEEIALLKSVRHAGVTGIFKRRETAIQAFARALDEESREIMVIGSSLKGLLQKDEYREIAEKLKFKSEKGLTRIRFLLTHPIVADFRASQEKRRPTEIGEEIILSLETLQRWNIPPQNVRLYLGTPTCFAIKTSRQMLINPYPYISVSYDSPCLTLEYSPEGGAERPSYFFDEFNSRHFGAWDTDLAVPIEDYGKTISHCKAKLSEYAQMVESILATGKALP
jgi:hypothetical protein